ncbi:hypothetical protein POM88_025923 [Heracleum sosnowskyi]|uniref:Uncharacterized protein n=1 Tax=Heracleum sosnowskyi TaxID=360622 RepID=A0AAD8I4W4_9APIA|nr:hypothetical protein POM88_025923 [Heracleum sosnowskyi]
MDLEFEKFCVIDGSPNIVLPCPRQFSRVEREKTSSKPHEILSPKQGFSDITFRRYRSASCKRSQPKNIVLEDIRYRNVTQKSCGLNLSGSVMHFFLSTLISIYVFSTGQLGMVTTNLLMSGANTKQVAKYLEPLDRFLLMDQQNLLAFIYLPESKLTPRYSG